ncbi:SPON1-like protein [Mya arenaria]|uniref:Spondin-1 n=1 Tax=Mya arenaria TaxID=6604 RepID=A0ABY7EE45_MYAAR|nr:SPON1-like protein [Mya arenaria]
MFTQSVRNTKGMLILQPHLLHLCISLHSSVSVFTGNLFTRHDITGELSLSEVSAEEKSSMVVKNKEKGPDKGLLGLMLVSFPEGAKDETVSAGNFSLPTDHVKAAKDCGHTVIVHHYLIKKNKMRVNWTAPASGCVVFKATVISENTTKWHKDDGGLTTKICDEEFVRAQGDVPAQRDHPECCACGEARYKMVFEGLWSRQTHPKDFPSGKDAYLLHWSNIVGASHTEDYHIWKYGGYAERGVREVCEYGYSSVLEQDMKQNSDKIYTVIKTSPMWRDVTKTREAVFKVNQKAHMLSLITMVGPSPDWCIGIPSVSVCQANCTWADKMEVELYPWDAGTDDGIKYINPRKFPTKPPERIHRITNMWPKHQDSPFYQTAPVKPMARVTLTKLKENCGGDDGSHSSEDIPTTEDLIDMMKQKMMMTKKLEMMKCATTDWAEWSDCSNNCGQGMRRRNRQLVNENILPSMCTVELEEEETCQGDCVDNKPRKTGRDKLSSNFEVRHTLQLDLDDPCAITPWSDWSPCSAKMCGRGVRERWRMFLRKSAQMMNCGFEIMEQDVCYGIVPDCRKAFMMKNFTAICSLPKNDGPCRGNFERWYYDSTMRKCQLFRYGGCRGNDNRFETEVECQEQCARYMDNLDATVTAINRAELTEASSQDLKRLMMQKKKMMNGAPQLDAEVTMRKKRKMTKKERMMEKEKRRERKRQMREKKRIVRMENQKKAMMAGGEGGGERVNCMLTEWSEWEECTVTCGKQYVNRSRMIKRQPENGGKRCPKKLTRKRKCRGLPKCPVDCKVTEWNEWGGCSATCGQDAVQERSRRVMQKPKHGGMDCPSLVERQPCNLASCAGEKMMKDYMNSMQRHPPST